MTITIIDKQSQDKSHQPSLHSSALSPKQEKAALLVAQGCTGVEVSKKIGVGAETVSRWKRNSSFEATANQYRHDILQAGRDSIRDLVADAIAVIGNTISTGTPALKLKASEMVLRQIQLFSPDAKLMCGEKSVVKLDRQQLVEEELGYDRDYLDLQAFLSQIKQSDQPKADTEVFLEQASSKPI